MIGRIKTLFYKGVINKNGSLLVDLGYGKGSFLSMLIRAGANYDKVIALDVKPDYYRAINQKKITNICVMKRDACETGIAEGSAELVLVGNCFRCFEKPLEVLDEIRRILKSDGRVLIIEEVIDSEEEDDETYLKARRLVRKLESMNGNSNEQIPRKADLIKLLRSSGMELLTQDICKVLLSRHFISGIQRKMVGFCDELSLAERNIVLEGEIRAVVENLESEQRFSNLIVCVMKL